MRQAHHGKEKTKPPTTHEEIIPQNTHNPATGP